MSEMNRPVLIRSIYSTSQPSRKRNDRGRIIIWDMEEGSSSRKLRLNIAGPDGDIVTYNVSVDLPMHIFLRNYCEHKTLEYLAMEFLYEGRRAQVRRPQRRLILIYMLPEDEQDVPRWRPYVEVMRWL